MKINKSKFDLVLSNRTLTKKEAAELIGVSRTRMSTILSTEIRPSTAGRIAKALGVDVADIIEDI